MARSEKSSLRNRFSGGKKMDVAMGRVEKEFRLKDQSGYEHDTFEKQAVQTWAWQREGQREGRLEKQIDPNPIAPMEGYWNFIPNAKGYFVK